MILDIIHPGLEQHWLTTLERRAKYLGHCSQVHQIGTRFRQFDDQAPLTPGRHNLLKLWIYQGNAGALLAYQRYIVSVMGRCNPS